MLSGQNWIQIIVSQTKAVCSRNKAIDLRCVFRESLWKCVCLCVCVNIYASMSVYVPTVPSVFLNLHICMCVYTYALPHPYIGYHMCVTLCVCVCMCVRWAVCPKEGLCCCHAMTPLICCCLVKRSWRQRSGHPHRDAATQSTSCLPACLLTLHYRPQPVTHTQTHTCTHTHTVKHKIITNAFICIHTNTDTCLLQLYKSAAFIWISNYVCFFSNMPQI